MIGNLVGMINVVFNIIFEIANLLLVISLLLAINKFMKKELPKNFVFLLFYLIISTIQYLLFELNRFSILTIVENQKFFNLFFAFIHYCFLAFFIKNEIKGNQRNKNNLLFYLIGIIILILIYLDKLKILSNKKEKGTFTILENPIKIDKVSNFSIDSKMKLKTRKSAAKRIRVKKNCFSRKKALP
jgi:hypothetical protein